VCGIAGVFSHAGPAVDADELQAMRDAMSARGPDGAGTWLAEARNVGLAHRRLAIVDLSAAGAQPMGRENCVIVFNGEIYNYRALRTELEVRGYAFRSHSDTEVLLALYAEHGPAMLSRLRGMYAFALWDGEARRLFLARDPFGIKPLYWADNGKSFRFASQVKALLKCPIDTRPEPAGHVGFFLWGSVPEPWTLYRGIRSLPAGHWLSVDAGGPGTPVSFGNVSDLLSDACQRRSKLERRQAILAIADDIRDSVRAHLEADVPVGVFLSAGLDSTLLASQVAATGAQPLTVTLGFHEFRDTADDEVPLAEAVARGLGADHATMWVRRSDFESERERILDAMDQPSIDGVNTWFVAKAAAQRGLKVALSGLGGDELFGSYPSFRDIPRMVRLMRHPARIPGLGTGFRRLAAPLIARYTSPKYAGLLEYGGTPGGAYLVRRGLYMPWELPGVLDPDLVREGWRAVDTRAKLNATVDTVSVPRLAVSALEMCWYMRNQLLRDADWAGMAHSLEIRVPLVDWPLLAAASSVFAAYPDATKRDVVATAAPRLPRELLDRPKTGFSVPVHEWIQSGAVPGERGLRGWARQVHGHFTGARI